ncbi:guanylate kinase [Pacificimonas sp. WHA3]|uniref:Guanylate kinase n=1 Tax=Pacificimonas pallii TaxID=2827236 RepID=A0ABS6SBK7_9SPHN|nr:guanylate kinase [Pacificimonas pallii]MBV7255803.1 guanylate kinase [Pacificimonas pallii]
MNRRGILFVLSSPSGAGKSTMARMLLEAEPDMRVSISATTRAPRRGEEHGREYFFESETEFDTLVETGALIEWAHVFDHRYGTPRAPVEEALTSGKDMLFDVDWQGTQQLRQQMREDIVSIFLLPPSMAELERRLRSRGTDSDDVIAGRMDRAEAEISHWAEYDYVFINDHLSSCFADVRKVVDGERLRRTRRGASLTDFVRNMSRSPDAGA